MGEEPAPRSPDEAFGLLGDATRLAILRVVWAADDEPISFTEIRERVGRPDSGQFNYHLDRLRGHFLVADEAGYRLTQAGREVVRSVLAGTMTERPATDPHPIDGSCADCGGGLVVRYDGYGIVACGDCGATVMWNEFPPAGLDGRAPGELAEAFDRWTRRRFRLAMDGVCPNCAAAMATTVEGPDDDGDVATVHRCPNCRYEARVPLFGHAIYHPAAVAFLYDRGVDVTGLPYWELRTLARAFTEEVLDDDPWRAAVTVRADGDELRLVLDADLEVVDVSAP